MKNEYQTNFTPGRMSFADGFMSFHPHGEIHMQIDRKKARKILKELLAEGLHVKRAEIGLNGDWTENSEVIYENGKSKRKPEFSMYEHSDWATPMLIVWFSDLPNRAYECWKEWEIN